MIWLMVAESRHGFPEPPQPSGIREPEMPAAPWIFLAASTERSLGVAGRYGFGTMMSSWTPFPELARQAKVYRQALEETPEKWRRNGARGRYHRSHHAAESRGR